MKKRKWVGSFTCRFSPVGETINHLFFTCRASVYVWSSISSSFGVLTRPTCFTQYFWWIAKFLHARTNMYVIGVSALGWAIWKIRNKACFEGKLTSSPVEMVCYMCIFLRYWEGLQSEEDKKNLF